MTLPRLTRSPRRLIVVGVLLLAGLLHLWTGRYEVLSIQARHEVRLFAAEDAARDDWRGAAPLGRLSAGEEVFVRRCRTWHGEVVLEVDYQGLPAIVGSDASTFELRRRRAVVRQPRYATASCLGFFCHLAHCW